MLAVDTSATQLGLVIYRFESATPGTVVPTPVALSTPFADFGEIDAVAARPTTGDLYLLGTVLYGQPGLRIANLFRVTISPTSARATSVSLQPPADHRFFLDSNQVAMAFDPVTDRLRIATATGMNVQVDPATGGVAEIDSHLAFDPAFFAPLPAFPPPLPNPQVGAIAFTNNAPGAAGSTLYAYDAMQNSLGRIGDLNGSEAALTAGVIHPVALPRSALAVAPTDPARVRLAIDASSTAFAMIPTSDNPNEFGTINLSTGQLGGPLTPIGVPTGDVVRALLVAPTAPAQFNPTTYSVAPTAGAVTLTVTRPNSTLGATTLHYATANGTARAGEDYVAAQGDLTFADGEASKTITITLVPSAATSGREQFTVQLTSSSSGVVPGKGDTATVTLKAHTNPPAHDTIPPALASLRPLRNPRGRIVGFELTFNEAIDASRAEVLGNYTVTELARGRFGRTHQVKLQAALYDPSAHTVTLYAAGRPRFAGGAQIVVNAGRVSTSSGIIDVAGNHLAGDGFHAGTDAVIRVR
jgi:hypothetical protein